MQFLVPIRFNSSVGRISPSTERFVFALGKALLGGVPTIEEKLCDTIPVSDPRDLDEQTFYESILTSIEDFDKVEQIILDVGGPHFNSVPVNRVVGSVLAALAKLKKDCPGVHKLLLFPKKLHRNDLNQVFFEPHVLQDEKVSCFFYKDQKLVGLGHSSVSANAATPLLDTLYQRMFSDREESLRRKMICHLGKYSISDQGQEKIIFDYYDGSFAHEEIYKSIKEILVKLVSETPENESVTIAIDDNSSKWFQIPFQNALEAAAKPNVQFSVVKISDDKWPSPTDSLDAVLSPIMRTGQTIRRLLDRGTEEGLMSSGQKPFLWALVDLTGFPDAVGESGVELKLSGSDEVFLVYSDIREGERGEILKDIWGQSNFQPSPVSDIIKNLEREFFADEMWAHVFEAGLQENEDDIPLTRSGHDILPNFKEIIRNNGPLLAAKIISILEQSAGDLSPGNAAFVHPDEEATNLLADAIFEVAGYESIPFSKKIIELSSTVPSKQGLFEKAKTYSEQLEQSIKDEFESLETKFRSNLTLGAPMKVVALTEFYTTGVSIAGLYNLARFLKIKMVRDISLAEIPSDSDPMTMPPAAHTFYRFG